MIIISSTEKSLRFDVKNIDMCVGTVLSPIVPSTENIQHLLIQAIKANIRCFGEISLAPITLYQQDFYYSIDLMLRKACFILQIQGEISGS